MRISKGYLFRACYSKRVSHHSHCVWQKLRDRGVGKLNKQRKRGAWGRP